MIDRRSLLAGFASMSLANAPWTAFAAEGPDDVIRGIYKRIAASFAPPARNTINGSFTWMKEKSRRHFYSASLVKAWDHADAITAKGDQNPPGSDPITNSQDPMVLAYDVKVERRDARTAIVVVMIDDKPGPVTLSENGTIRFDMVLERGRWRIDDIRPGTGKDAWSLRQEIVNHKG